MADLVLDTHACVHALSGPAHLGRAAQRALERVQAGADVAWIPAVAVAEIVMLKERGRVSIGLPELRAAMDAAPGLRLLAFDAKQLDEFVALSAVRDPFDRLIVAACRAVGGLLITRDARLQETGLVRTIWR